MKCHVLFILATVSINTFAQPSSLIKRTDANPPYIINQYQCELFKMTRREDGSTFGPVKDFPASTNLAVTSEVYESLASQGVKKWLAHMDANKEIASMSAKAKQFEDSGNIPAMKHWEKKAANESLAKQRQFVNAEFQNYIANASSDYSTKTYHEPANGNSRKYASLNEMKMDFHNYCNVRSTLN
jgi:hypothetical protein